MKNIIIISIIIVCFLSVFFSTQTQDNGRSNFKDFNENTISGRLTSLRIKNRGVGFKVSTSPKEYVFYPRTSRELNNGKIFNYFAVKGDSILKEAFSDTLYIFKEKEIYKYNFIKIY